MVSQIQDQRLKNEEYFKALRLLRKVKIVEIINHLLNKHKPITQIVHWAQKQKNKIMEEMIVMFTVEWNTNNQKINK